MTWYLNSEGFSLGAFPALYVLFTSSLKPGSVQATNYGAEWWHRYAHVGVPKGYPNVSDALDVSMSGVVNALVAMRPDQSMVVQHAAAIVRKHGDKLRFLLRRRETSKQIVEISANISASPKPSYLFISHTDKATNVYREAEPIALGFFEEGFDLRSGIRLQDAVNLKEISQRPMLSGLIKRQG